MTTSTVGIHVVPADTTIKVSAPRHSSCWITLENYGCDNGGNFEITLFFADKEAREKFMMNVCEHFMRAMEVRTIDAPPIDINDSNPY